MMCRTYRKRLAGATQSLPPAISTPHNFKRGLFNGPRFFFAHQSCRLCTNVHAFCSAFHCKPRTSSYRTGILSFLRIGSLTMLNYCRIIQSYAKRVMLNIEKGSSWKKNSSLSPPRPPAARPTWQRRWLKFKARCLPRQGHAHRPLQADLQGCRAAV